MFPTPVIRQEKCAPRARGAGRHVAGACALAAVAAVGLVGCGGSSGGAAGSETGAPSSSAAAADADGGGQYATELSGRTDFTTQPDGEVTGEKAQQQIVGGRLVLTNLGPTLGWQSFELDGGASSALFVAGELEFAPEQMAAGAPATSAGVGIGAESGTWDYFLTCDTTGKATLQRSSADSAVALAEYSDVGCAQQFSLGLEAYSPGGGSTQLTSTLPDGSKQTFTDDADYGPFLYYGFMVYGKQYPATVSVLNGRSYAAPA